MIFSKVSLSATQFEVLDKVADSCPDAVYLDWTYRSWVGALSNLKLVTVGWYDTKGWVLFTHACVCHLLHKVNCGWVRRN